MAVKVNFVGCSGIMNIFTAQINICIACLPRYSALLLECNLLAISSYRQLWFYFQRAGASQLTPRVQVTQILTAD